ncbi:MAG: apolipoprotein N-acyltransferase [Treponema sp.]|nr:apolipoprotein N-acyltransferase [Treponema sp.]
MIITPRQKSIQSFFINLALTALAAVLFAASFPNLLIEKGIPLLAWIAYVPIFLVIQRTNLPGSVLWGALYGYSAYGLFNYWLSVFHPLAGVIVSVIYVVYMGVLFPLLKLAAILFPKRAYLVQWVLWIAYEYLRTLGFLGYSYGITGYSQWRMLPVIQIASIFGVWGVSALVVFPSVWLAASLKEINPAYGIRQYGAAIKTFFLKDRIPPIIWVVVLCASLAYGFISMRNYDGYCRAASKTRIALIQHNTDPWKGGLDEYRGNFEILRRLSDEALAAEPKPDMVVWSETAFVPRIYWHQTYRDDSASWTLVKDLLDYLSGQEQPFVIGNDDARKDPALNPNADENYRVDYNAVMLFERGKLMQTYRKLHLVPFTEHFPYQKQFPGIYQALVNADTHFWEKGSEETVFSGPGFRFSSPICFEDTFGCLSRDFVRGGADLIINLSNDAWSASLPAQNQHLSMAIFRAVENRRSMARSTASGQTCAIDPTGRIIAMAPPFKEAWITAEIPITDRTAMYTRYGDFLGIAFSILSFTLLIFGGILFTIRTIKQGKSNEYP